MAYQNVGTPIFYVDHGLWLHSLGLYSATNPFYTPTHDLSQLSQLNPSSILIRGTNDDYYLKRHAPMNYAAFLGHEHSGLIMYPEFRSADNTNLGINPLTSVVNGQIYSQSSSITYDGFSICEVTASDDDYYGLSNLQFAIDTTTEGERQLKIGSIFMGQYYDMPHSPDLSLKMSHEYKGIKKQESMGGSTLTNVNYYKPPDWGNLEAWQLGFFPRKYSGRRIWNLTFSYLSDDKVEPKHYDMDETHSDWKDNWFSNVLHYTMGGALPFIFQPDNSATYTTDDGTGEIPAIPELAICRFDMNTYSRTQVAHNMYTISVKIEESW